MKVLFFCQERSRLEHLALALRLRWPDLKPLIATQSNIGL